MLYFRSFRFFPSCSVIFVLLISLFFSANTFADVFWQAYDPATPEGYFGHFASAAEACEVGKERKEAWNADITGMEWRNAPGQPFYFGGSYIDRNDGKQPGDPDFAPSYREVSCNHEYRCLGCGGWAPPGWATFWPYSGATVQIAGDICPAGQTDTEALSCGIKGAHDAGNCNTTGSCNSAGNPIHVVTGNKYQIEVDYSSPTLQIRRVYNSLYNSWSTLGSRWRHNYSQKIITISDTVVQLYREDGKIYRYENVGGTWQSPIDKGGSLVKSGDDWLYTDKSNTTEKFDRRGRLNQIQYLNGRTLSITHGGNRQIQSVTDDLGNQLYFTYNSDHLISSIKIPGNRVIKYQYNNDNLTTVIYPDSTNYDESDNPRKIYHYEDPAYPHYLTGLTNENGIRFATWEYNTDGKADVSYYAGNVERVDIVYNSDGTRVLTNSRGNVSTYQTAYINDYARVTSLSGPGCTTCGKGNTTYNFDPGTANLLSKTENGLTTEFGNYDTNGNYGYKIIAVGTPEERRTDYTYDPRFKNKIATITEPSVITGQQKVTTYTYDNFGNRTSATVSGFAPDFQGGYVPLSRTTNFTYAGPLNQLSAIDGPRPNGSINDITQIIYYPNDPIEGFNRGLIKQIIGPEGISLRNNIQYTATGKVASEERPNGILLSYSYEPGTDRLETLTETGGAQSRTTRWTYLASGEVKTITQALGTALETIITLGYDDARRLTSITDALGNKIEYTLDGENNRTKEDIKDADGTLHRTLQQTFDAYNQLDTRTLVDEVMNYNFVANGTLDNQVDAKSVTTSYGYDSLRRLTQVTGDVAGTDVNTQDTLTQYFYDVADRLTQVVSPNGSATTYVYDDLGNLLKESSSDRGDRLYTYDEAGNVSSITDARGIIVNYAYDGLNRVTSVDYPGTDEDVTFTYDSCLNGVGQLCQTIDQSGVANNTYSPFGNLIDQVKTELGVVYTTHYDYDLLNRITKVTTPSGREVDFKYNAIGQIRAIDANVNGLSTTILHNALYRADGLLTNLEFGNGFFEERLYNLKGRLTSISMPVPYIVATSLTANAGSDQLVAEGQQTYLNGLNSVDPSGSITSYSWTQVSGPVVTLSNGNTATPSFISPVVPDTTTLEFQLTVTNASAQVAQDNVIISVQDINQAPIANAGGNFSVNEKQVVLLDGSNSTDPDGTIVSYYWEQIDGPALTVSDPTSVSPTITIPNITENTDYTYRLRVTDNHGSTTDDIVVVTGVNLEQAFPNLVNGTLTSNTVLDPDVTYQLSENITVPAGITLTVSEGVVLQAAGNSQLIISGGLQVNGTIDNPVLFTSGEPVPSPGIWNGIKIQNGAAPVSISYATIEYASNGVWFNDAGGVLSNSTITNNINGVYTYGYFANPSITSNTITNNEKGIYVAYRSVPVVTSNVITDNNSYGIHVQGQQYYDPNPNVTNNDILNNGLYNFYTSNFAVNLPFTINARNNYWGSEDPLYIESTIYDYTDNNTSNTVVDYSQYLDTNRQPVTTALYGIPANTTLIPNTQYTIIGSMLIPNNVTLTIPEGVTFNFPGNYHINVWGSLNVAGTTTNPVTFTSQKAVPSPGDWQGIKTSPTVGYGSVSINNAVIEYASIGMSFLHTGGSLQNSELRYNQDGIYVYMLYATPTINNNYIHDNSNYGIHIYYGAKPSVTNNEITANNIGIYSHDNNQPSYESLPTVTSNKIYNNTSWNYQTTDYGRNNAAIVNAKANYWGSIDALQIAASIYDGADNTGSAYVDYTDFRDENMQPVGGNHLYVIDGNQTLTANTTYQVIGSPRIQPGTTLTIPDGVRIEIPANYAFDVSGALNVVGSQASPVVFTSSQANPQAGNWQGIVVNSTATGVSISNALIEYANYGIYFNAKPGIVTNSEIRYNNTGIYAYNRFADVTISNNYIHNNVNNGIYSYNGANPVVSGNEITSNNVGILARGYQYNTGIVATNNDIYNNLSWNYQANQSNSSIKNNWTLNASNNWWGTTNANEIKATINDGLDDANFPYVDYAGFLDGPGGNPVANHLIGIYPTTTLQPNTTYHVVQDVYIPYNYTLNLPEGTVIKFDGNYRINANGKITANGVDGNPVVFTSGSDTPAPLNWYGVVITFYAGGSSFNYTLVEYSRYGLYFNNSTGQVTNSELRNNYNGVFGYNMSTQLTLSQNYAHDNTNAGFAFNRGAQATLTANEITKNNWGIYTYGWSTSSSYDPVIIFNGNNFYNNYGYNLYTENYVDTSRVLDGTGNWWGTTDSVQIDAGIFDLNDGSSKPTINYSSYLTEAAVTVGFNLPPIANAGVDQSVNEGSSVILDGSASSDANGGTITGYSWSQTSGPGVVLSDTAAISPTFTAPIVAANTTLTFELSVTDDGGLVSTDTVDILVQNLVIPPTADAGVDQTVNENSLVNLIGGGFDSDGTIVAYSWVQTAGPAVTITNANSASASFTAPAVIADTNLTFELTVSDNDGATGTDTINVLIKNVNVPPVANAGTDQMVSENTAVNLNGSGSDSDGSVTSYAWTQIAGPAVTITNANSASASFTAMAVTADTLLTFQLTVTDNNGATATDNVNVTVQNVIIAPTANAGSDQIVNEGDSVILSGSGSDTDGTITAYAWTQTAGTPVTLTNSNTATPGFTAPLVSADEVLTFQLVVTDNDNANGVDTVNVTVQNVNQLPTANAGMDQSVNEGDVANVTGGGTDADGTIANYSWIQTAGPAVTLTGADTANVSFTAPAVSADTAITLELTVTDNDGGTGTDSVIVTVINVNALPTADAGVDQNVSEGDPVSLTGSGADTDGTIDAYSWVQMTGTVVTLNNANTANASFTAPTVSADETLVFELTVTDNDGSTATDTINITVQNLNELPVANAGIDQTVTDGDLVTLDGSGSFDNDGTIASYSWVQTAGPVVTLSNPTGSATDFTAPAVSSDTTLSFELMVTDDAGDSTTDAVDVLVQPLAPPPSVDNYYILNSRVDLGSLTVVSLVDGNTITAGNTTLNLDRYQSGTIPAADLAQGTKISGTGPFDIGGTIDATDMPVPETFAGTEFVIPHYRNGHTYILLSPDADANVDIDINGVVSSITLIQGVVSTFDAGATNLISGVITADKPILMAHMSGTNRDAYAVPPATVEVLGFRTNNFAVGAAQDNTSVTLYATNGTSKALTLNKGEYVRNATGSNGNEGTGDAIHVVADKPIAAVQVADSDGNEATAFWSPAHFATRYTLPVNTQYVAVSCLDNGVDITLTDGANPPETQVCTSDGLTPGKVYFGSTSDGVNISAGAIIESTAPIYLIYEESSNNDEHNLLGNVSEQTSPMVLNTVPVIEGARTMLANESSKSTTGDSQLAVVAVPDSKGNVQYRVWRKGPETNGQWMATAEDPNAYDRPDNVLYLTENTLHLWRDADGQDRTMVQQAINGESLIAQIHAQFNNRDAMSGYEFIKVHHGGTAPTGDTINRETWTYSYDGNGNVEDITTSAGIKDYSYDALNRVTGDIVTGDPSRNYTYDRNGNRIVDTEGTTNNTYTYVTNSNQLDTDPMGNVVHDPAGNRTSDQNGGRTFTYNNAGRLHQVFEGAQLVATYTYNAQGQRTRKVTQSGAVVYHFDLAGNLLSETDETGALIRDYVYMNSVPVAQIDNNAGTDVLTFIHTDHLGTPRRATNPAGDVVWSWDSDAFGKSAANEDPDNDSTATIINLRFAGQYYDAETALHYNYFRYYDPGTGRYVTSDPIGLWGGPNTYAYVGGNPVNFIDPYGLDTITFGGGVHLPIIGDALKLLGFSDIAVTGFEAGIAISFPGFWDSNAEWDIGVFSSTNLGFGVGANRATIQFGYNKGSVCDIDDSLSPYVISGPLMIGTEHDPNTFELNGINGGFAFAPGKIFKSIVRAIEAWSNGGTLSQVANTFLNNSIGFDYKISGYMSASSEFGDKSQCGCQQ